MNGKLVLALHEAGHKCWIITSKRTEEPLEQCWSGIAEGIVTVPWRYPAGRLRRVAQRFTYFLSTGLWCCDSMCYKDFYRAGKELCRREKFDVILCRCGSFSALIAARKLHEEFGIPFVVNINDPFLPYPPPDGWLTKSSYRWKYGRLRRFLADAAAVTFPCAELREYESSWLKWSDASKFEIVPHIAYPANGSPSEKHRSGRINIVYSGGLGKTRPLDFFIKAMAVFAEKHPEVDFQMTFAGTAPQESEFELIRSSGLEKRFVFLGRIPYSQSMALLLQADIVMIIEAKLPYGIYFPSKLVDILQAGKKILSLSPRHGTLRNMNERYHFGTVVDNEDLEDVCKGVEQTLLSFGEEASDADSKRDEMLKYLAEAPVEIHEKIFQSLKEGKNA